MFAFTQSWRGGSIWQAAVEGRPQGAVSGLGSAPVPQMRGVLEYVSRTPKTWCLGRWSTTQVVRRGAGRVKMAKTGICGVLRR